MSTTSFRVRSDALSFDHGDALPERPPVALAWAARDAKTRQSAWASRFRVARTVVPYLVVGDVLVTATASSLVVQSSRGVLVVVLAVLLTLGARGAHRSRLTMSALDDVPDLALAALLGAVAHSCWLMLFGHEVTAAEVKLLVALAVALITGRALAHGVVRHVRSRGFVEHRALVLGAGDVGRQIARAALEHPECGLRPVGFLDAGPVWDDESLPVPLLGHYDDLADFIREEEVSEVIVAFLGNDAPSNAIALQQSSALVDIVRACDRLGCEIFTVPRLHELRHLSRDMDELWGIPLVRAHRATWRTPSWLVKRMLDVVVAGAALLLLTPVMLAVALAVRIESGSRVLFRQVRVGLDGEPFTLLKFRSLTLPGSPDEGGGSAATWSIDGHARLGPVGRFIRSSSLDELPQLLNILRGKMSLVGPRPERPEFVAEFTEAIPRYTARHRAPAGLTGLAQVNGLRGDTSIEDRARFDNYYIQNWSLWLDVKILVRTVSAVLLRRGS